MQGGLEVKLIVCAAARQAMNDCLTAKIHNVNCLTMDTGHEKYKLLW